MEDGVHPFGAFFRLGFSFVQSSIAKAIEQYERLHKRMSIYIFCALLVIFICWLINIFGEKQLIHLAIILGIIASYYFLLLAQNSVPMIAIVAVWLLGEPRDTRQPWWKNLVSTYFLVISTITYTAVWPLLLLTWLDFSHFPPGFLVIFAGCLMIISADIYAGKEMKWVKYFCVATPERLLHQLGASMLRLTIFALGLF